MNELESINFEQLDKELKSQIQDRTKELEGLKIDRSKIGKPKQLIESISQIVWEQFVIQISGTAGQDFIKKNHDLNLCLKRDAHFLNSSSFVNGEMPAHNFANAEEYQQRSKEWSENFKNGNPNNGIIRDTFDQGRIKGNASIAKDHTIPVEEIIRDKDMATFVDQNDKVAFANNPDINLKDLDSAANCSKGGKAMREWLDSERNGQKPEERFNINRKELLERDDYAREKEQELINEKKAIAEQEGQASRRAEALKSVEITTQAIVVALLAKLTRTIFQELIRWFMEKDRNSSTLIEHLKKAIKDFFFDFKNNVLLSADISLTVVLTQLFGEIIPMIRKSLLFVKIGGNSLFKVVKYLKDPANEEKHTDEKVLEIGKIVTIDFTTAGAIGLGMAITATLEYCCPIFSYQIPVLGSAASLLGIFLGGLTSGICGAIVLYQIDDALVGQQLRENTASQIVAQNGVIALQGQQFSAYSNMLDTTTSSNTNDIKENHLSAIEQMQKAKDSLKEEKTSENKDRLNDISKKLDNWDI